MPRSVLLEFRRDTAAHWTSANPVLAAGEPGYETDTGKLKIGDGSTAWSTLAYFAAGSTSPLTTKGDLFGHSTVDARIPVGSNDQVLIADSTQTVGVKWGPAPAGAGGALTLIGSTVLAADAANLSVGSIPGSYSVLWVVLMVRSTAAVNLENVLVQFNADTTAANYFTQFTNSHGATVGGFQQIGNLAGVSVQTVGSTATANVFNACHLTIPQYASTTPVKGLIYLNANSAAFTSGNVQAQHGSGFWNSTAAITSLTVVSASAANLKAGSMLAVYGMS